MTGLHQKTTLMSIGIVSEFSETFYAELNDYDESQVDDWLKENVIANFKHNAPMFKPEDDYIVEKNFHCRTNDLLSVPKRYSISMRCNKDRLKQELIAWLDQFKDDGYQVKMVSDCLAYDWVLFNEIFGHAFNIPDHVNYIPYDITGTFSDQNIDPDISREEFVISHGYELPRGEKHNALYDAKVIQQCYHILKIDSVK